MAKTKSEAKKAKAAKGGARKTGRGKARAMKAKAARKPAKKAARVAKKAPRKPAKAAKVARAAKPARPAAAPPPKKPKWMPEHGVRVSPIMICGDVAAACAFYDTAFGFETRFQMPGPDGKVGFAEVGLEGASFMLSVGDATKGEKTPKALAGNSQTNYVYVPDADKVWKRATGAGAEAHEGPKDQFWGDRTCIVGDPDGHCWMFATKVRDVKPEDMKPEAMPAACAEEPAGAGEKKASGEE